MKVVNPLFLALFLWLIVLGLLYGLAWLIIG